MMDVLFYSFSRIIFNVESVDKPFLTFIYYVRIPCREDNEYPAKVAKN
jgi:hypothetical protein